MDKYYNEWIEKEKEWRNPFNKRFKQMTGIILLIEILFGLYVGIISENFVDSIVLSLPMMVFIIFFITILYVLHNKIYIKRIKKAIKNSIPNEKEQISFMKEILAMS